MALPDGHSVQERAGSPAKDGLNATVLMSNATGGSLMADLPTGTVTFLFTDIEGSTRLWEQHPEAMRAALARHDALLRQAIEARGGHVFKTMGDQFCAAFAGAPDA